MAGRTLRWRIIFGTATMLAGTVGVGVVGVGAVEGMHADLSVASAGYEELRHLFGAGFMLSRARDAMSSSTPNSGQAEAAMQAAADELKQTDAPDRAERLQCVQLLRDAALRLRSAPATPTAPLNPVFSRLSVLSAAVKNRITVAQLAADRKREQTVTALCGISAVITAAAIWVGVRQYRSVITPLRKLGQGARAFSAGTFAGRLDATGDREFADVVADFNKMADQLQSLYESLESQVRAKSRELVQSERLASVGYLAAGVAHEINNPLGIIAGYGERAQQHLKHADDPARLQKAGTAIGVICDEAFRCKRIIDGLLSLAAPGAAERRPVSLGRLAENVIAAASGLDAAAATKLSLRAGSGDDSVVAVEGEIKQVVLNLVVNAVEATGPSGVVEVGVGPVNCGVELWVADDGRGMTADVVAKVFEPFFTTGGARRGTGLGLSIAHAIVTDHGGTLTAQSDGPGRGSRFTLCLPAAGEVTHGVR